MKRVLIIPQPDLFGAVHEYVVSLEEGRRRKMLGIVARLPGAMRLARNSKARHAAKRITVLREVPHD